MANKVINSFLSLAFLATLQISLTMATVTVTSNFDNYATIITKLTNMNDRLTVYRAVWGEIRADDAENVDRIKGFYDNLLLNTRAAVNSEAEEAAELSEVVRRKLVTINGHLLAETLNWNNSQAISAVKLYRTKLLSTYSVELLNAIFELAIDEVYSFKSAHILHSELSSIDPMQNNANTYQVGVHWNLYMYYKFLQRGDINDDYVFAAALAFRNIRDSTYYRSLPTDIVRHINAAFNTFPTSLFSLVNSTTVCLENANIFNYYLYYTETSAVSVQAVIRNRFEASPNRLQWINTFADYNLVLSKTLSLKTKSTSWFLYRQSNNPAILIQKSDTSIVLRNWIPSLRNDKIMFEQSGQYMCATSNFVGELLGFAVQSKAIPNLDDTNCQWIVTDCSKI